MCQAWSKYFKHSIFKCSLHHNPISQGVLFTLLLYGWKNLEKLNERTKIKNQKLLGERSYILKFYKSDSRDTPLCGLPGNV